MKIKTYTEFWPFYLREHRKPQTRRLHFAGAWVAISFLLAAALYRSWLFLTAAVFSGYALAWYAHFAIEKNRPATFTYPLWSFISDWRMWYLDLTGQLQQEFLKYNVTETL